MTASEKKAVGRRLREAAQRAGLTSDQLAERLGYSGGGVRGWWIGKTSPPLDVLQRYAEIVGVSLPFLVSGEESANGTAEALISLALRFADLVSTGTSPDQAVDQVTGQMTMTAAQRAFLNAAESEIRSKLDQMAGERWSRLTEAQKRQALAEMDRLSRAAEEAEEPL